MTLGKLDWASFALYFVGMSGIVAAPGFSDAVGVVLFHPAWGPPATRWLGAVLFLGGLVSGRIANMRRPATSVTTTATVVPAGTTQTTPTTPSIPLLPKGS
jgi:hypothetical protein